MNNISKTEEKTPEENGTEKLQMELNLMENPINKVENIENKLSKFIINFLYNIIDVQNTKKKEEYLIVNIVENHI